MVWADLFFGLQFRPNRGLRMLKVDSLSYVCIDRQKSPPTLLNLNLFLSSLHRKSFRTEDKFTPNSPTPIVAVVADKRTIRNCPCLMLSTAYSSHNDTKGKKSFVIAELSFLLTTCVSISLFVFSAGLFQRCHRIECSEKRSRPDRQGPRDVQYCRNQVGHRSK